MRLVLQTLSVEWTKKSRGAPGATLRNSVPRYLTLPDDVLQSERWWRHQVSFHEFADFVPATQHLDVLAEGFERSVGLRVAEKDGLLRCYFEWSTSVGAPDRSEFAPGGRFAFSLEPQQTGRLTYNGRLAFDHGWQYHQVTHNVGWVDECDAQLFRAVDKQFESLPALF